MSWCIHDAIELEKRGKPTVTICTDEFASLGIMEAKALQMSHLPIAILSHPLGGLKSEEVAEKTKLIFKDILRILKGR